MQQLQQDCTGMQTTYASHPIRSIYEDLADGCGQACGISPVGTLCFPGAGRLGQLPKKDLPACP